MARSRLRAPPPAPAARRVAAVAPVELGAVAALAAAGVPAAVAAAICPSPATRSPLSRRSALRYPALASGSGASSGITTDSSRGTRQTAAPLSPSPLKSAFADASHRLVALNERSCTD